MIGTSFVPSFNVIGQIFLKIEPEECFSKLRVNYHLIKPIQLIYSDGYNTKEIKRNSSTTKYFYVKAVFH
jgi:hypothetical protein